VVVVSVAASGAGLAALVASAVIAAAPVALALARHARVVALAPLVARASPMPRVQRVRHARLAQRPLR
jgi:hypothetical protein